MVRVSVVIPTHNRPELMKRGLRSVFDQQWPGQIDVTIVFDACEPFDPGVAVPWNRSVRTIANTRSRGLAGARNSGILASRGDFVAFLDDDDVWHPDKLARQLAAMAERPEALLCVSGMAIDNGAAVKDRPVPATAITLPMLTSSRIAEAHSSSFLFRRNALMEQIGLIDEDLPRSFGEDYDILIRTARLGEIAVIPDPLITVTWQGQSLFAKDWPSISDALQMLLRKHPEFANDSIGSARIEAQIAIAESGKSNRPAARKWAMAAFRHNAREKRVPLAMAMSTGLLSANGAARVANRFGRGL